MQSTSPYAPIPAWHQRPRPQFGTRLQEARCHLGMSQPALAALVQVTATYISKLEASDGSTVGFGLVQRLSAALGVSLDSLAGRSTEAQVPAALAPTGPHAHPTPSDGERIKPHAAPKPNAGE
jgi:transcriptional regulator with XRE-family HTH domain